MVPSLRYGISQKNNADIQLVIDALEVAYKNELIDSFCIVSGDSDYTPLVGRLKSMGKFVLGISRSEAASNIFINACNEFQFLETVGKRNVEKPRKQRAVSSNEETADESELNKLLLRTYDAFSPYPEEFNRQATGIVTRYHFSPTPLSRENLIREGKKPETVYVTGNTVIDALQTTVRKDYTHPELDWASGSRLILLTAHRRENLGNHA